MNTAQTEFTIIAIGGGGFTHETDPDLEDFIPVSYTYLTLPTSDLV